MRRNNKAILGSFGVVCLHKGNRKQGTEWTEKLKSKEWFRCGCCGIFTMTGVIHHLVDEKEMVVCCFCTQCIEGWDTNN